MPYVRIIPAPSFFFHVFEVPDSDVRTSTYITIHGYAPVDREKIVTLLGLDDPRYWNPEDLRFHRGLGRPFRPEPRRDDA